MKITINNPPPPSITGLNNCKHGVYENDGGLLVLVGNNPRMDATNNKWENCFLLHSCAVPTGEGWYESVFTLVKSVTIES